MGKDDASVPEPAAARAVPTESVAVVEIVLVAEEVAAVAVVVVVEVVVVVVVEVVERVVEMMVVAVEGAARAGVPELGGG